jgi:hypothetical protein
MLKTAIALSVLTHAFGDVQASAKGERVDACLRRQDLEKVKDKNV